jgi:hypothetical protein
MSKESAWSKLRDRMRGIGGEAQVEPAEPGEGIADATVPIAKAVPRSEVCLQGTLVSADPIPHRAATWLVAVLSDGTGEVSLIWMGRGSIPGIEPGRTLRVKGRLAIDEGRKVIFNPYYQLIPLGAR